MSALRAPAVQHKSNEWKLAEAKNKLSEVVTKAVSEGPQFISRREDEVVVISKQEYLKLKGEKPSLVEFIMNGPDLSILDLSRKPSYMREVDLGE